MTVDQKKIDEAIATLREAGYVLRVWTDEDIEYVLNDVVETDGIELDEAEVQRVIQEVKQTREWESLGYSDDWQWELIAYAVEDALGI